MAESEMRKELSPGVTLLKVVRRAPPGTAFECTYEYRVDLQRFNVLEFTADFSGSESVTLEEASGLVRTTNVQPFKTETVAVLSMSRQWSLKSRFKFTLRPVPKSTQEVYLVKEEAKIKDLRKRCAEALAKVPVSLSPLNELEQLLMSKALTLIDPEFPPEDSSIFRDVPKDSLDSVVHWRRPGEFLGSVPGASGQPSLFGEGVEPLDVVKGQLGDNWFLGALATLAERPALVERLFLTKQPNPLGVYRVKVCERRIARKKVFSEYVAYHITRQLLSIVKYLHDVGIVHRDIKPENILLTDNTEVPGIKLADFGLAKLVGPEDRLLMPCGTLAYVAPEVLSQTGYNMKVDLWSVGVVTYLMLRGKLPFDSKDKRVLIEKTIEAKIELGPTYWDKFTPYVSDFLEKLLTKNVDQRLSCEEALLHPWIRNGNILIPRKINRRTLEEDLMRKTITSARLQGSIYQEDPKSATLDPAEAADGRYIYTSPQIIEDMNVERKLAERSIAIDSAAPV